MTSYSKGYSELEIVIQRDAGEGFQVSARHRLDEGDSITPFVAMQFADNMKSLQGDPSVVGQALSVALFGQREIERALTAAKALAADRGLSLRVRLRVAPGAAILHSLPWETLIDPVNKGVHLFHDGKCVFSRYLFTSEFRLPLLRPKQGIQAFFVVANPQDLAAEYDAIDAVGATAVAMAALRRPESCSSGSP